MNNEEPLALRLPSLSAHAKETENGPSRLRVDQRGPPRDNAASLNKDPVLGSAAGHLGTRATDVPVFGTPLGNR